MPNVAITVLLFSIPLYLLFFCPQHLVISAFRCAKAELNFNDQWDALIIDCLHICFTDHAPSLSFYCLFVWKISSVDMLDYTGAFTRNHRTNTRTKHNSVQFLSEVTSAEASVFLVCFSGIITTSLFFSLQLLLSQNQKSSSCINGGIPSWILLQVFHSILPKNSHVPDTLLLLFSPLSLINSVMWNSSVWLFSILFV